MKEASGMKFLARLAVSGLAGFLILPVATETSVAGVTLRPTVARFNANVGTLTYKIVRATNTGTSTEVLVSASATNPPFWPTWGGTCNISWAARVLAPGQSCTFQFGFHPTARGTVLGVGTLYYLSGTTATVRLRGRGR
jgi:hypothetical protein